MEEGTDAQASIGSLSLEAKFAGKLLSCGIASANIHHPG